MAFSFASADVLHLDPEWEEQECRARKFLLWPAYAYRVLAPEPRARSLNLLQRHVLSLCRAHVTGFREVAELLDLHPDLAATILDELQGLGILNEENHLTRSGEELFDGEHTEAPTLTVTHVFQDPWTGQFLHRLADSLQRIEAPARGPARLLQLGTRGKPIRELALALLPPRDLPRPEPPDVERIVEEARLYHQEHLDHLRLAGRAADDEAEFGRSGIERVALVGADPVPVLLTALVYTPKVGEGAALWQARDPFGLGDSPWLREALQELAAEFDALKALLQELQGDDGTAAASYQALARQMQREAEAHVENRLTGALRDDHPKLFVLLVEMAYAVLRVQKLGREAPAGERKDVVGKANNALEQLFEDLRLLFDTKGCYEGHGLLRDDKKNNAALLRGVAGKLGFDVGEERELDGLFRRDLKGICQAADYPHGAIGPRVLATLLTAHRTPEHPLWQAAPFYPDLLRRVMRLADLRNKAAAHAGGAEVEVEQMVDHIETVYRTVGALLLAPRAASRRTVGRQPS